MDVSLTRVLAFINMGAAGFASLPALGELAHPSLMRAADTVALVRSDTRIRGIKLRMARGALGTTHGPDILLAALRVAEDSAVPLMIHVEADCPMPLERVVERLRAGDIVTPMYHGGDNGILDGDRQVLPAIREAQQRGVRMDVGHGGSHFDLDVAQAAISQDLLPDTISTDGWAGRPGSPPQYALPYIVSELIAAGLDRGTALVAVTRTPAEALGLESHLGTLRLGGTADIAGIRQDATRYRFTDPAGHELVASALLRPAFTFRDGELLGDIPPATDFRSPEVVPEAT
jgi:dihydroorotase